MRIEFINDKPQVQLTLTFEEAVAIRKVFAALNGEARIDGADVTNAIYNGLADVADHPHYRAASVLFENSAVVGRLGADFSDY